MLCFVLPLDEYFSILTKTGVKSVRKHLLLVNVLVLVARCPIAKVKKTQAQKLQFTPKELLVFCQHKQERFFLKGNMSNSFEDIVTRN